MLARMLLLIGVVAFCLGGCDPSAATTSAPLALVDDVPSQTDTASKFSSPTNDTRHAAELGCCKICRKGKACGNSCIARHLNCHQPPGCACDGFIGSDVDP